MNYIGSKLKLSSFLYRTITDVAGKDLSKYVLCDLFAGTGVVGRVFKTEVKKVISNDCEYYSSGIHRKRARKLRHRLQRLPDGGGWIDFAR